MGKKWDGHGTEVRQVREGCVPGVGQVEAMPGSGRTLLASTLHHGTVSGAHSMPTAPRQV